MHEIKLAKKERDLLLNLANIFNELRNIKNAFPTIHEVRLSSDLSFAKIYVSFLSQEKKNLEALSQASGYIKKQLSRILKWRRIPDLEFKIDKVSKNAARIEEILDKIKNETN